MTDHASLVFLSYNRPQFIFETITSAVENAGYPCEVIVHDDGSTDPGVQMGLLDMLCGDQISRLILNPPGHNEGVGTATNRGFLLATGDPIIKLDQDLLYTDGWLARVVGILRQDEEIGMLGLFKYHHDPVRWQDFEINVPTKGGYHYTRQFCGSAMAIPRHVWEQLGPFEEHSDAFAEDQEYMQRVRMQGESVVAREGVTSGLELALPDVDLVTNRGFGIGPSTVVEEGFKVHEIHHGPHLLGKTPPPEEEGDISEPPVPDQAPFDVGVVITTCAGREENLKRTIAHLDVMWGTFNRKPEAIVVVYDGCSAMGFENTTPIHGIEIPKHQPGQEQPRNVGFRRLLEVAPECNYCWFLDSDLIFDADILSKFHDGFLAAAEDRILIGRYDWLKPHTTDRNEVGVVDYRDASFRDHGPEKVFRYELGSALACFGGNLMWPVAEFQRVGGFHTDMHHGRCEDGELGLRAASAGVPISFVREARAWHVWHEIDVAATLEKNARDVPLINQWHPWVEGQGLIVSHEDGARFNFHCPECGEEVNSLDYWTHTATHKESTVTDISVEGMPSQEDEVSQGITVRRMDIREFREIGWLHEINRLVLHPAGLALEVSVNADTNEEHISGVWDCREDPEGVCYGDEYLNAEKAKTVAYFIESRGKARQEKLGYVIQPLPPEAKQLVTRVLEPSRDVGPVGAYNEGEES